FVECRSLPPHLAVPRVLDSWQSHQKCSMVRFFQDKGEGVSCSGIAGMCMDDARVPDLPELPENPPQMLGGHQRRLVSDDARGRSSAPFRDIVRRPEVE